jgi:hypothetical protein
MSTPGKKIHLQNTWIKPRRRRRRAQNTQTETLSEEDKIIFRQIPFF